MWAMMPMLRVFARGTCLGMVDSSAIGSQRSAVSPSRLYRRSALGSRLPAIVGKGLVRLRHPVRVLALLHRAAAEVRGIEKFVRQLFLHRLAVAAGAGIADQ